MRASRLPELALALLLVGATAGAQDAESEARGFLQERRYAEALEAAERIEDDGLRAEWRFHVLTIAGDLPGALAAARSGLRDQPENPRLLENASRTACALGLGSEAAAHARRLVALESADPATAERAADLAEFAAELERRELAGVAGVARARLVSAVGAALLLWVLLVLARATRSVSSPAPQRG